MEKELFFSVISIKEERLAEVLNEPHISVVLVGNIGTDIQPKKNHNYYLWAIWDIFPSDDIYRPPILSGVGGRADVIEIAQQNGFNLDISFNSREPCNAKLKKIAGYDFRIISFQKRQSGRYFFCVWSNHFRYLCGSEPIFQQDNVTDDELKTLKITWGDGEWAGTLFGRFIKNHVRRREAQRKLSRPPKGSIDAVFVDFLYSPQNTWYIPRKRWIWQRHRIVKKTKGFIFVEEFPYQGGSYLKTGWQAFIAYTIMINRKELEETHQFEHKFRRKIFYEKCAAPELKNYRFNTSSHDSTGDDDDYEDDFVFEMPLNKVQWALNLLNINEWPTTRDAVKKAFNPLSMKTHPDRGGDNELFVKYRKAHDILMSSIE